MRPRNDPTHPSFTPSSDRSIAERVPFALGSALREYGDLSGRRHDLFDKTPLGEAPLMLVGMGPVGDALFAATSELRARGYDVGAIHICTLRPFPAARLVKTLARALAITILEPADEPFSHGGLLARELKSAFTDALTWAPGYPGIGRIPKLFCGVTGPSFDAADLAATCDNMLADERGRRSFSFAETEHALPRSPITELPAAAAITMRWVFDDEKTAALALSATAAITLAAIGARTQAIVAGTTLDVIAMREHARGGMARRSPRIVLATELGVASSAAVAPLVPGAVLGVFTWSGDAALPDAARAIVRERRVRALPLPFGGVASNADRGAAMAAACAGAALAVGSRAHRTAIDGALVSRLVTEHVPNGASVAEHARRAYESTLEALVAAERDRDAANDPYRSATAPVS